MSSMSSARRARRQRALSAPAARDAALLLASRANAALAGRDFVTPDDVKS